MPEQFSKLENLYPGYYGKSYLAKDAKTEKKVAVKQVECLDESKANRACKLAAQLGQLSHENFCPPINSFVTWEQKTSSTVVNIVSPYMENGNLELCLLAQGEFGKPFSEEIVRKWLAQLLEVLLYLHQHGMQHRNLHPRNIYIHSKTSLMVGDVALPPLIDGFKKNTRISKENLSWLPPEFHTSIDDDDSSSGDIWSLGYILLRIISASHSDKESRERFFNQLTRLKQDEITENISHFFPQEYSAELMTTISQMLQVNPRGRPTLRDLMEQPYCKECLGLAGSALVGRRRKQEQTLAQNPLPGDENISSLLIYLEHFIHHENLVKGALNRIRDRLSENTKSIQSDVAEIKGKEIRLFCQSVAEHGECEEICLAVLQIFCFLAVKSGSAGKLVLHPGCVDALLRCMQMQPANIKVNQTACGVCIALGSQESLSKHFGDKGGMKHLVDVLDYFSKDADFFAVAANALWIMCVQEDNLRQASRVNACSILCRGMRHNAHHPQSQEHGAAALLALSLEASVVRLAASEHVVEILLKALRRFPGHIKLVINVCNALSSFVQVDEESALLVVTCECELENENKVTKDVIEGMSLLVTAYGVHKADFSVVEAIVNLIDSVLRYEDLVPEVFSSMIVTLLRDIRKKYIRLERIAKPCESSLAKLGARISGK